MIFAQAYAVARRNKPFAPLASSPFRTDTEAQMVANGEIQAAVDATLRAIASTSSP